MANDPPTQSQTQQLYTRSTHFILLSKAIHYRNLVTFFSVNLTTCASLVFTIVSQIYSNIIIFVSHVYSLLTITTVWVFKLT